MEADGDIHRFFNLHLWASAICLYQLIGMVYSGPDGSDFLSVPSGHTATAFNLGLPF